MKYLRLIALVLALATTGALSSLTITHLEYFFDADPGQGNGAPIYGSRDTLSLDETINTSSLSPGVHRLYIRAIHDQGSWSLPQSAVFIVPYTAAAFTERDVATVEYFFDTDPGQGNATQLYPVRNAIDLNELVSTAALNPGIHRLFVRSQNDEGTWGLPQSAVFFVPFAAAAFAERDVARVEYFFDADPGTGNATQIYPSRNAVDMNELITTSALTPGIHRIFVRAKDDEGAWGLPQRETFFIIDIAEPGTMVTSLEYFIDADPGLSLGTRVDLPSANPVSVTIPVAVGQINHGNHCLYFRAKNSEGGWGLPACCQFSDGIPAQVTISIHDGMLMLSWEDLYGIDTYKVYSAPLPEDTFAEEDGGTFGASTWTSPASYPKRFYQIKSVYGE